MDGWEATEGLIVMTERCAFCQGDLEERLITYPTEHEGRIIVIENVPALTCTQCGESVLRPEVAEKLQQIIWGKTAHRRTVRVDAYDYAEVA